MCGKLEQRGQKLDALEPRVRRIVRSVRQDGDRALRRYAERWDGLGAGDAMRVPESEMQAALNSASRELRMALETAAGNIRNFCEWQKPAEWEREKQGRKLGQLVRPLAFGGMLRAWRTLSPAVNFADDGDSGAGCRGEGHSRGFAATGAGDAGGGSAAWECGSFTASAARRQLRRWLTARRRFRG